MPRLVIVVDVRDWNSKSSSLWRSCKLLWRDQRVVKKVIKRLNFRVRDYHRLWLSVEVVMFPVACMSEEEKEYLSDTSSNMGEQAS